VGEKLYAGSRGRLTENFALFDKIRILRIIYSLSIFSERELMFTFAICYHPSVCRLSVCLSVTLVRPTQAVQIFGNISTALFIRVIP